jgi:F420-0:gamma-glutamyl ligase-like protein
VDTLTNAPTVPSAAAIASTVRTELITELACLDAPVTTRLAAANYTAPTTPPTTTAIAAQVRTELSPELARVANCSTVDTTATTIRDAVSG